MIRQCFDEIVCEMQTCLDYDVLKGFVCQMQMVTYQHVFLAG